MSIEEMYQKVVAACLECNPIPAHLREDDKLEPPWEVVGRILRERDEARKEAEWARDLIDGWSEASGTKFSWENAKDSHEDHKEISE